MALVLIKFPFSEGKGAFKIEFFSVTIFLLGTKAPRQLGLFDTSHLDHFVFGDVAVSVEVVLLEGSLDFRLSLSLFPNLGFEGNPQGHELSLVNAAFRILLSCFYQLLQSQSLSQFEKTKMQGASYLNTPSSSPKYARKSVIFHWTVFYSCV